MTSPLNLPAPVSYTHLDVYKRQLMGRTFARPERMRMFFKQYLNEMVQLGVNSIGIVLLLSLIHIFFGFGHIVVRHLEQTSQKAVSYTHLIDMFL